MASVSDAQMFLIVWTAMIADAWVVTIVLSSLKMADAELTDKLLLSLYLIKYFYSFTNKGLVCETIDEVNNG